MATPDRGINFYPYPNNKILMSAHEPRHQPILPRTKVELSTDVLKSTNERLLQLDVVQNARPGHFSASCSIYATTVLLAHIIEACPDLLDQRYARLKEAMQVLCEHPRLQEDLRQAVEKRDFMDVLNVGEQWLCFVVGSSEGDERMQKSYRSIRGHRVCCCCALMTGDLMFAFSIQVVTPQVCSTEGEHCREQRIRQHEI